MSNEIKKALKTLEAATANCTEGARNIVVLPRGFIFAGNLSLDEETSVYTLTDCVNVRKWSSGGFGGLTKSAKASGAILDPCEPVKFHRSTLCFAVPITKDWGSDDV